MQEKRCGRETGRKEPAEYWGVAVEFIEIQDLARFGALRATKKYP
jgi:hypothetical protein